MFRIFVLLVTIVLSLSFNLYANPTKDFLSEEELIIIKSFESQLEQTCLAQLYMKGSVSNFDVLSSYCSYRRMNPPEDEEHFLIYTNDPPTIEGFLKYIKYYLDLRYANIEVKLHFILFKRKVINDYNLLIELRGTLKKLRKDIDSDKKKLKEDTDSANKKIEEKERIYEEISSLYSIDWEKKGIDNEDNEDNKDDNK